ncbi:MAG: hypothetical protein ACMUIG_10055, partial [Thermoplasmatota archaeon]
WNLMFLRHSPGPVYLWYEIVHPRFLRKTVDEYGQPGMDVHDVVVDSYDELRSVYGKKELHPADLKKVVADELMDILDRFRIYFKENPDSLKKVKKYKTSIGR